jgi:hypothetical protein
MSEYQYYEFQAIDRPLTSGEVDKLRSYSTRAQITSTSFTNDYSWGSFKGDPDAWMEKYFDAFLYLANWGTHVLKLRLPSSLLSAGTAKNYLGAASVREKLGKVVLSFVSEDEEGGGDWVEGEGQLSSMISVRADLMRGDRRALYLGWLLRAQAGELDDDTVEPPVPPGLGQLNASLEALAEFMRIDRDLICEAAEMSPPLQASSRSRSAVCAWVKSLPAKEKDETLTDLILEKDHAVVASLLQRFLKDSGPGVNPAAGGRTVGDLLRAAEQHSERRQHAEAELRKKQAARREKEAAIERANHLKGLAGHEGRLWNDVKALLQSRRQADFAKAVSILVDLRDLAGTSGATDFDLRIGELRQVHARKRTFLDRLKEAGV